MNIDITNRRHDTHTNIWLTRKEASAYLRIGESTLAKLFVSGGGPEAIKIGKSVRYCRSDLDAWMSSRKCASTSDRRRI